MKCVEHLVLENAIYVVSVGTGLGTFWSWFYRFLTRFWWLVGPDCATHDRLALRGRLYKKRMECVVTSILGSRTGWDITPPRASLYQISIRSAQLPLLYILPASPLARDSSSRLGRLQARILRFAESTTINSVSEITRPDMFSNWLYQLMNYHQCKLLKAQTSFKVTSLTDRLISTDDKRKSPRCIIIFFCATTVEHSWFK